MRNSILYLAALGLTLAAARADDGPPKLDIEKTCSSPGRKEVQVQGSQQDSQDGCLRSERAAHDDIKKRWHLFTADAKSQCSKQSRAGGFPSYVETVTCLELASGTPPGQTGDTGGGTKQKPQKDNLTAEPSPKQRTNPIEVLEKR